jgi:Xaa-Pro aminopeptidase
MKSEITERVAALREFMRRHQLAAFIVPSTDAHAGEYVPAHWESRKWISGFTGSAGTAVITLDAAGLWTDSRYFLQAADQLEGTGIALFKDKLPETPSITAWLAETLSEGDRVGIDGWVNSQADFCAWREELQAAGLDMVLAPDPFAELWTDRPALPTDEVKILPLEFAGQSAEDKIAMVREAAFQSQCDGILISALDEIAWTLNLRGTDVHCNPVFVSYLLVDTETTTLYIIGEKLRKEVRDYLAQLEVEVKEYTALEADLRQYDGRLRLAQNINAAICDAVSQEGEPAMMPSPVLYLKSIKNVTEQEGFRRAMERDGVAMVKFLRWIKAAVPRGGQTELSIDEKLTALRAEHPYFRGISFDTIAGYRAHGAIVHYEATPETDVPLKPEGMLLLDSGAQYLDGTTDITRTIVLGPVTDEEKTDYTLVLQGFLHLSMAEFPYGTCGTQLDALARIPMWKAGINYLHGTGHGVGSYLNVHEGPHQFRMNHMPALLLPGMTVTVEPGIYKADRHGVRTENTMLIVPARQTEFGEFYRMEPLTLCPIDKEAIRVDMLTDEELQWFNDYHRQVYDRLEGLLEADDREWLKEATAPLTR